ncbi:pyridoxamine 5'-phosphate oxidase family protein [Nocardioides sp.]|uniref:pyridoxamine 5'-phosphate oxidase family protein n=1 Tax=Nocardioides sp. TaxID=35761 RepID=UPI00271A09F8|nr:pyridoxamine 5'-phosphate oxidase family protein [Nocardioides sp.]MDO9455303.1 pyridoxamine 5'-phosphate oxidase family protein [Nocardioides sp.]
MAEFTGQVDARYGDADAAAPPWAEVEERLEDAPLYWLVTVRADGRPHAVPLVGVWHDQAFAFVTGQEEQKMRNLEANAHVAVTAGPLGADGWAQGKDIVVEGTAARVTDDAWLRAVAAAYHTKYGADWPWQVDGDTFVTDTSGGPDTGGPGPGLVFQVTPVKVIVFGDDHGQTTYRQST